ncbi:MAG: bifunctional riboflavin kinase/FAD synthetase [Waddliaceae bacterium]
MKLFHHFKDYGLAKRPIVLTIGNFDGVHRGHQAIISHVVNLAKQTGRRAVVITFNNHPSKVLTPGHPIEPLNSPKHKVRLIEDLNVDVTFLLTFTKEFSEQDAKTFLQQLNQILPFSHLILGHDATIGKDRKGDRLAVLELSHAMGFHVDYLEQVADEECIPISSSRIRNYIKQGNFSEAGRLLGRRYSIVEHVSRGTQNGSRLGYPTANIDVTGLCLPPFGVYAVHLVSNQCRYEGVANLGIAPTLRTDRKPILEIYLFKPVINLYEELVEVFFFDYIRPEKQFSSADELKNQIAKDIVSAKNTLNLEL